MGKCFTSNKAEVFFNRTVNIWQDLTVRLVGSSIKDTFRLVESSVKDTFQNSIDKYFTSSS